MVALTISLEFSLRFASEISFPSKADQWDLCQQVYCSFISRSCLSLQLSDAVPCFWSKQVAAFVAAQLTCFTIQLL